MVKTPPLPAPLDQQIDRIQFIVHATDVGPMPSPLPEWTRPWIRTAKRAGLLLANHNLRTCDVIGLKASDSVFAMFEFVVHVPVELNHSLRNSVSVTQQCFRLDSREVPSFDQIIRLPVVASKVSALAWDAGCEC